MNPPVMGSGIAAVGEAATGAEWEGARGAAALAKSAKSAYRQRYVLWDTGIRGCSYHLLRSKPTMTPTWRLRAPFARTAPSRGGMKEQRRWSEGREGMEAKEAERVR